MKQSDIQHILQLPYNRQNWKQFLSNLFNDIHLLAAPDFVPNINRNIANEVLKLGNIVLNENGIERFIGVYEVTLAKGIVLERNRVGLRNLLRKYWKNIDGAFIAFSQPDNNTWRFTYVSELTGFDIEGELIQVKTEPKRYTYILGEGESCRTAAERFYHLQEIGSKKTIEDIKDAFSVEKLSKAFFEEYYLHYRKFCNYLKETGFCKSIFNGDEKAISDFNKKLLGRLVFLYFIQKKGWLGVPEKSTWGQGDNNFLFNLFGQIKDKELFYSKYLSKLFFDTLNTYRKNDLIEIVKGHVYKIPYLNGGLFEEEDHKHRTLVFPGEYFHDLFDFFNQYNFTIYEDDPYDHTVAVDPEMLGHIFENLLEDNKDKGAFYTPKEVVHYMCQESLIEYLINWFWFNRQTDISAKKVKGNTPEIDKSLIERLIKKKLSDKDIYLIKHHSSEINRALDKVKICDPAIGSGAFPMGLLHEIFTVKQTLYFIENNKVEGFDSSNTKLNIIQNSIYGVDVEKGAVDIARLRFWLSLIVDEPVPKPLPNLDYKIMVGNSLVNKLKFDGFEEIIEIEWDARASSEKTELLRESIKENLDNLFEKQKIYFNYNGNKNNLKIDIRNLKIDLLIKQLELSKYKYQENNALQESFFALNAKEKVLVTETKIKIRSYETAIQRLKNLKMNSNASLFFFDWKIDFPEVMNKQIAENVGFDIVIANPPYLKERDNAHIFKDVNESRFGKLWHQGKMDYWFYFLHKAIDISNSHSIITFITSRYWLNSQGAKKIINRISEILSFRSVVDIGKLRVFDNVAGQHMIAVYSKDKQEMFVYKKIEVDISSINKGEESSNVTIKKLLNEKVFQNDNIIFSENIFTIDENFISLGEVYDTSIGVQESPDRISLKHLEEKPSNKIKAGDGVFVLKEEEYNKLNLTSDEKAIVKPYLDPNDVERYIINRKEKKYLIYSDRDAKRNIALNKSYNNLKKHLDKYTNYITSSNGPYGLHRPRDKKYFINPKIIFKGMFVEPQFAYDEEGYYFGFSFTSLIAKEKDFSLKYLLTILNSKFAKRWFYTLGKIRGAGVDIGVEKLRTFPIKNTKHLRVFEILVDYIMYLRNEENSAIIGHTPNGRIVSMIEEIIDMMVYELYFEKHMIGNELDVLKYINPKEIIRGVNETRVIKEFYLWYQQPNNNVRNRIIAVNIKSPDFLARINNTSY